MAEQRVPGDKADALTLLCDLLRESGVKVVFRPTAQMRDEWGREVRRVWVEWAKEEPNPKPSWLVPFDELSEPDKEVDRRIGEALTRVGMKDAIRHFGPQVEEAKSALRGIKLVCLTAKRAESVSLAAAVQSALSRIVRLCIDGGVREKLPELLRPEAAGTCTIPPAGWVCTREKGHRGPCAAWPVAAFANVPASFTRGAAEVDAGEFTPMFGADGELAVPGEPAKFDFKTLGKFAEAYDRTEQITGEDLAVRVGRSEPGRKEQCVSCLQMVSDWFDPDWADGRICRACETKLQPVSGFDVALNCPAHLVAGDPNCPACVAKQHPSYHNRVPRIGMAVAPTAAERERREAEEGELASIRRGRVPDPLMQLGYRVWIPLAGGGWGCTFTGSETMARGIVANATQGHRWFITPPGFAAPHEQSAEVADLRRESALLTGLIELGNRESEDGKWVVSLDWDNYQDGARVLDGDGVVLGECYEVVSDSGAIQASFRAAIEAAIAAVAPSTAGLLAGRGVKVFEAQEPSHRSPEEVAARVRVAVSLALIWNADDADDGLADVLMALCCEEEPDPPAEMVAPFLREILHLAAQGADARSQALLKSVAAKLESEVAK